MTTAMKHGYAVGLFDTYGEAEHAMRVLSNSGLSTSTADVSDAAKLLGPPSSTSLRSWTVLAFRPTRNRSTNTNSTPGEF